SLKRKFHHKPLLASERPVSTVLLHFVVSPGVVAPALGQFDSGDALSWIIFPHSWHGDYHQPANGLEPMALRRRFRDCSKHFQTVLAMQKGDALVTVLCAEAVNNGATRFLGLGGEGEPLIGLVISHNQRVGSSTPTRSCRL